MIEKARYSTNLSNDSDNPPAPIPPSPSHSSSNVGFGPSHDADIGVNDENITARIWSMTAAQLIPRRAAHRFGSHDGDLKYFCVYGHLQGLCWLAHLSIDDEGKQRGEADDDGGGGGDDD